MSAQQTLVLGIPSKGRLMEQAAEIFAQAGLPITKTGPDRGYQGRIESMEGVEVAFLSASEIAHHVKAGTIHLGITGEDLLREDIADFDVKAEILKPLGFGNADVVVAVPDAWLDVWVMADLDDVAIKFHEAHDRRLKVATKYLNLTRRFFTQKGVTGYRIAESLGATEGAPAAGTAEVIVDITSTGSTLKANHLRILEDGLILQSQAVLVSAKTADWSGGREDMRTQILKRLG